MTKEEEKAIEIVAKYLNFNEICGTRNFKEAIETVLNMLKEKDIEIEKKDNVVKKIINRLDNDIKRITESKVENYCDDYRKCRLKAYRTKTKEIKKYIEEQYFERKESEYYE